LSGVVIAHDAGGAADDGEAGANRAGPSPVG